MNPIHDLLRDSSHGNVVRLAMLQAKHSNRIVILCISNASVCHLQPRKELDRVGFVGLLRI